MPELPEVEIVKRELTRVIGKTVSNVDVSDEMLLGDATTHKKLREELSGSEFVRIRRVGKFCLLQTEARTLLFSLRMTGNLTLGNRNEKASESFVRLSLSTTNLWFTSVRRFSKVHLYETTSLSSLEKLQRLGPDPLRTPLSGEDLETVFRNRTAPVKTAVMNQECLAGLGNIYANEICHAAGTDPRRSVNRLTHSEFKKVAGSIQSIIKGAIQFGGSSIRDFNNTEGKEGGYQDEFYVYGRDGEGCYNCSDRISKITLAGRSTFWCPNCQD